MTRSRAVFGERALRDMIIIHDGTGYGPVPSFEKMGIADRLDSCSGQLLPMHMPGHKRNTGLFPWLAGLAERDFTEIPGLDNLNDPEDVLLELEARAAGLWGSEICVPLVNGSTVGILACVMAALEGGGELLMCRSSHLSVYHGAELAGARTRYLSQPPDLEAGIPTSVQPAEVEAALTAHPGIGLVCVTSPTYEGVISDIPAIADICHRHGVPLLVDCAHGAHLGMFGFPEGPFRYADMTVMSLHKTLPCLTPAAMLCMNRGLVDTDRVRQYVSMLQTSSPSYLVIYSVDRFLELWESRGDGVSADWVSAVGLFWRGAGGFKNIHPERLTDRRIFAFDRSKLVLCSEPGLGDMLRRRRVEPEYSRGGVTLCMTGMGDTAGTVERLLEALTEIDGELNGRRGTKVPPAAPLPRQVLTIRKALRLPGRPVPLDRARGLICGEYAWAYPPGIPLAVPGEELDEAAISALRRTEDTRFTKKHGRDFIFCVDLPGEIV